MTNDNAIMTSNTCDDTENKNSLALARLLQLSSATLPVGGYAFSQGMEYAIECAWLKNAGDVQQWIKLQLMENMARVDIPVLRGVMQAVESKEWSHFKYLNDLVLASRETKELRLTDSAMGEALLRLLKSLDFDFPLELNCFTQGGVELEDISFVTLFAYAAAMWDIDYQACATGFIWSWLENQVASATKLVPLGQTQAQQLLTILQPEILLAINAADETTEQDIGGGLPALAIASALHETQYSRLFRS